MYMTATDMTLLFNLYACMCIIFDFTITVTRTPAVVVVENIG